MKAVAAALFVLVLAPAAAMAGPCDKDIKAVDTVLQGNDVPPDQRAQVKDMRQQAADLCKAGNEQEGLDVLSEAKAMLNIQ